MVAAQGPLSPGSTFRGQTRVGCEGCHKLRDMGAYVVMPEEIFFSPPSSGSPLEGAANRTEPQRFGPSPGSYEGEGLLSSTSWLTAELSVQVLVCGRGLLWPTSHAIVGQWQERHRMSRAQFPRGTDQRNQASTSGRGRGRKCRCYGKDHENSKPRSADDRAEHTKDPWTQFLLFSVRKYEMNKSYLSPMFPFSFLISYPPSSFSRVAGATPCSQSPLPHCSLRQCCSLPEKSSSSSLLESCTLSTSKSVGTETGEILLLERKAHPFIPL